MATETNFIREKIIDELKKRPDRSLKFRFPPEPNGYLHLGHAKAICLNYSLAKEFNGTCHLRFDDTNPNAEETVYIDSIKEDLAWLGVFDPQKDPVHYSSENFQMLYNWALALIKLGLAYVCELSPEEMKDYRGNIKTPGRPCPGRSASPEANYAKFIMMKDGVYEEGDCTLRAKIDLTSSNMNLRDPVMYRIIKQKHHQTGNKWCIYPAYDWAHGQCDAIERITHSLCTIEYEGHRPLYNWFLDHLQENLLLPDSKDRPEQTEFAPLVITHTVLSKRKLRQMVAEGMVTGWDDPRMPTLSGMRRRGFTPEAIHSFCNEIGVTKNNSILELALLENYVRDHFNEIALRRMVVTQPLKLIIENYPEDQVEEMEAQNHPQKPECGTHSVPFSRELWIEAEDFRPEAPKKYFRLVPGREVRLRYAYYVTCTRFETNPETGEVTTVYATYDPATRGGSDPGGRKVKGTIHWVPARFSTPIELRHLKPLFSDPNPESHDQPWIDFYDPTSLTSLRNAQAEPVLMEELKHYQTIGQSIHFQFERQGYYSLDVKDSDIASNRWVLNQTVTLRDGWAKIEKKLN